MKNQIFKAQVAALFEKKAFLKDPADVAGASPNHGKAIQRGMALEKGFADAARGGERLLNSAGGLAERVLTTGTNPNGLLSRGVGGISRLIQNNPKAAIGTAAMLPILSQAFGQSQQRHQDELMHAYNDPSRVITASLEDFLEKKAAAPSFSIGNEVLKGLVGGLTTGAVSGFLGLAGSRLSNIKNTLMHEPRRKALLENLMSSDSILKDAITRHPESKNMILEAYGTMVRFAPSLSLDINAVRSFLREAVLGGSGVNYATIKNIVDTEKSITGNSSKPGGK